MDVNEQVQVQGRFRLYVYRNGSLIEKMEDHNMVVLMAKRILAQLVGGSSSSNPITRIAVGTNGSGPAPSDTQITAAFTKGFDGVSYPVDGQVCFSWTLGSNEANGKQIREFGLLTGDGSLFARKVRDQALTKASDITICGQWTISF